MKMVGIDSDMAIRCDGCNVHLTPDEQEKEEENYRKLCTQCRSDADNDVDQEIFLDDGDDDYDGW